MVRVRRSSDNATADFGGSLFVSWPAISTFLNGSNGFITKFYDQSGNGHDLAQTTAASQPKIILASNGLPALLFDGVDDSLKTAAFTLNESFSFDFCFKAVSQGASQINPLSFGTGCTLLITTAHVTSFFNGGTLGSDSTSMPIGTRGVVGVSVSAASTDIEINSAAITSFSGSVGGSNSGGFITIGQSGSGGANANIEAQELVVLNDVQTSTQLKTLNASVRAAWSF
jgi:hypothetical protein